MPKATKQSAAICSTCRARKVRCDGHRDGCRNCLRLGFDCSFISQHDNLVGGSLAKRRVRQACVGCQSQKLRCSGHAPACTRCRDQNKECVYQNSTRNLASTTGPSSKNGSMAPSHVADGGRSSGDVTPTHLAMASHPGASSRASTLPWPDESLIRRVFDVFFRQIHHIPVYSFLHRPSLLQRYATGHMDDGLLLALVGISTLLTDMGPGMESFGARCIDASENLVLKTLEKPSIIKIQTLVFIIKYRTISSRFASAFMLMANAMRLARVMRLNHEAPHMCFLACESRRRLMWSLYLIDTTLAGGYTDFSLCSAESIHVQLPCLERNFEIDLPEGVASVRLDSDIPASTDVGSLALFIKAMRMRDKVLQFNKKVIAMDAVRPQEMLLEIQALQAELEMFSVKLLPSSQPSPLNIRLRMYSPELCPFIMIHIVIHSCYCILYRVMLSGIKEALSHDVIAGLDPAIVAHARRQCVEHAQAMADIFAIIVELKSDVPVMDIDLAVCAYQCARILWYSFRTPGVESLTLETVWKQANSCLELLQKLPKLGEAFLSIETDLQKLMDDGLSTASPASQAELQDLRVNNLRSSSAAPENKDFVLSKHSMIRQMEIVDETESLTLPPMLGQRHSHSVTQSPCPDPAHTAFRNEYIQGNNPPDFALQRHTPLEDAFENAYDDFDFSLTSFGMDVYHHTEAEAQILADASQPMFRF